MKPLTTSRSARGCSLIVVSLVRFGCFFVAAWSVCVLGSVRCHLSVCLFGLFVCLFVCLFGFRFPSVFVELGACLTDSATWV